MGTRYGKSVTSCLNKARDSALQAVEIYNKPARPFRSGGYVVLMVIAWTSLLHAIFLKRKLKPYYRRKNSIRFERVDGDYKWWELSTCLDQYWAADHGPVRMNLEFFIKLRNKIEHRSIPELDTAIFGHCQSMLYNFDDVLETEFGEQWRLSEALCYSLQFRKSQPQARRAKPSAGWNEVSTFVDAFRSSLSADIHQSQQYCYQVYLLPRTGNHRSSADVAIEWVEYDPNKPEEMEEYERLVALIKPKQVQVSNLGALTAGRVAKMVSAAINRTFSASYHHVRCWRHFGVRPEPGASDPTACKTEYCTYDEAHGDYVYTPKWVSLIVDYLSDPANYDLLFPPKSNGPPLATPAPSLPQPITPLTTSYRRQAP